MCSEFIARTVRTAVPRGGPGLDPVPGRGPAGVPPGPADGRPPRTAGGRGAAARRVRQPAGRPQGPGRVDPGDAADPPAGAGRDAGDRGRRPVRGEASQRWPTDAPDGSVVFAGQVSEEDLPRYYAMGDVFAMPCRSRLAGMEVEGWGNVFIEASACGRPDRRRRFRRRPRDGRSTVRRASSSTAADVGSGRRRRRRSCSPTPSAPAGWGRPGANAWSGRTRGRRSPARLAGWLREAAA